MNSRFRVDSGTSLLAVAYGRFRPEAAIEVIESLTAATDPKRSSKKIRQDHPMPFPNTQESLTEELSKIGLGGDVMNT